MCLHINDKGMPVDDIYDSGARLKLSKTHLCETKRLLYRDANPKLGNIELRKHHGNVRPS